MADNKPIREWLPAWLQLAVITMVSAVGIWQFWFKEIWSPAAAPLNLTMEVAVKEAGFNTAGASQSKEPLEAIELTVTAKNPSIRDLYLLTNCWYATGLTMLPRKYSESFVDAVTKRIEQRRAGQPRCALQRAEG